jgi:hypothetical protein
MLNKKHILVIDAILLLGVLTSVFLLVGYSQPMAIAPLSSEENNLIFTIPATDYILIDTSTKFDSPENLFIEQVFHFEPGRYFIKFFDGTRSEIREINFEIATDLEFRMFDSKNAGLFNIGKNDLRIDTYDTGSLVDSNLAYSGSQDE